MGTLNWQNLASTSPYQTAKSVEDALRRGDVSEAAMGIEELIEALSRSDKRALRSHLTRLMAHIIKWKCQPEKRARSWRATIRNARREIADIREETSSLNRTVLESMWQSCMEAAQDQAEADMNQESAIGQLSWQEVFEDEFKLN